MKDIKKDWINEFNRVLSIFTSMKQNDLIVDLKKECPDGWGIQRYFEPTDDGGCPYFEGKLEEIRKKWNKEIREMIQSNKKEELPVGCGHNLYGYNLALDQLLKQLEEKP